MNVDFLTQTKEGRPVPLALQWAGQVADANARRRVFVDYQERKSGQTLRQQQTTLALFRSWLSETAADPGDLYADPDAWTGITWGLVADFIRWQLGRGYAVSTVNNRLSAVKKYAVLALQAGTLDPNQYAMIRAITGYGRKEARHLDEKRVEAGLSTRTGHKALEPILLAPDQVEVLKTDHPDTPQGRRDRLMLHIFLDLGLRCGEVAGLMVNNLHLKTGELRFYREKVDQMQTHRLNRETRQAARVYIREDKPDQNGPLLLASHKSGELVQRGISNRAVAKRVRELGERLGIEGLSAHDLRHTWATYAARRGTDPFALQEAGGWASLAMPRRYVEAARVANQGVKWE